MVIDSLEYASEVIAPNGNTWFFHDHGGMRKVVSRREISKIELKFGYIQRPLKSG